MLALPPHILPELDPSQGGFRWGADAMAFSLVDSLRLRRHEHTLVAFIDIKKAFDSCWVEATLVRLFDFGVTGRLWHLLANFLCGTMSQVRLGGSVSSPWVDSGIAQGRVLSPLLFNLLIDSLAVTLRSALSPVSPSLPLTPSVTSASSMLMTSSFSPLPTLTFSWPSTLCMPGVFAGASPFGVGRTKSATVVCGPLRGSPDCCVHLGGVPLPLGSTVPVFGRCPLPHSLLAPSRRVSMLPRGSSLSPSQCPVSW